MYAIPNLNMELNQIRDVARQGSATPEMNTPYAIRCAPQHKDINSVQNCRMSDILNKIHSLIQAQS